MTRNSVDLGAWAIGTKRNRLQNVNCIPTTWAPSDLKQVCHQKAGRSDWIVSHAISHDEDEAGVLERHHLSWLTEHMGVVRYEGIDPRLSTESADNFPIVVVAG